MLRSPKRSYPHRIGTGGACRVHPPLPRPPRRQGFPTTSRTPAGFAQGVAGRTTRGDGRRRRPARNRAPDQRVPPGTEVAGQARGGHTGLTGRRVRKGRAERHGRRRPPEPTGGRRSTGRPRPAPIAPCARHRHVPAVAARIRHGPPRTAHPAPRTPRRVLGPRARPRIRAAPHHARHRITRWAPPASLAISQHY